MITETFDRAYKADEAVLWRNALNKDFVRKRIIEKRDLQEWALMKDYDRPLKFIGKEKVPFIKRVVNFLRMFIP